MVWDLSPFFWGVGFGDVKPRFLGGRVRAHLFLGVQDFWGRVEGLEPHWDLAGTVDPKP